MTDRLPPSSPAFQRRQAIWRHNGHNGSVAMMIANLQAIITSPTTTDESRALAHQALALALQLRRSLARRREP